MDDSQVIEMLKRVGREAHRPPLRHDIDELVARGRRARRRRRAVIVPASSIVIVGAAALGFAMQPPASDRQVFLAPSGQVTTRSPSATQTVSNYQVLQEALGDDFGPIDPNGDNPGGNVTVRSGSPSAEGLPTGLTLWASIFVLEQSPESGDLAQLCAPMVEKNVIFSACTTRVLPDGKTVYVRKSRTGPGGVKPGRYPDSLASDGVRVLFELPHGNLVIVDLSTQGSESDSTAESRAAVQAWLNGITPRIIDAATDPRVGDTGPMRVAKPSGSESRR